MSYQVLAQKYRPQVFSDVIGQEAVTRTLKNSVEKSRIANAYIFCGPRGVGKTSVARLLSKTLNCEKGGSIPCNKCFSCTEISQSNNIDVLEIDGASNRGIDEIRTLRENVKFSPSKGKFKIYIIDEVHMLTPEAFNALLKTLEEPPAHVKFIFATTEPHKVLPTIMSRCQRYDFKKIPPLMILDRLDYIAKEEKIAIDKKASILIARASDGSLRDALVILDQMVSFSGKKIVPEDVVELLGMVHKDKIFELSDAIIDKDPRKATIILDELINCGKDPVFINNSLISHYRDLMVLKTSGEPTSDMAFSDDEMKRIKEQLEKLSLNEVLYILQNLTHCLTLMKGTMFARSPLEIALIRLTKRSEAMSLPDILSRLEKLEGGLREPYKDAPHVRKTKPDPRGNTPQEISKSTDLDSAVPEEGDTPQENVREDAYFDAANFNWKAVLHYVKTKKMSVFTFLNAAKPIEVGEKKIVIGFDKEHAFNKDAVETNGNKVIVEEAVNKVAGFPLKVEFRVLEISEEAQKEETAEAERREKSKEEMKPVIEKAMDVFGGHVVRDLMEDRQ